jgi:methyl-accepting chemotaxis protein
LVLLATEHFLKELPVKKIALTLIAVSALGLAACSKNDAVNNAVSDLNNTQNAAVEKTEGALNDMHDAANTVENAAQNVNDAAGNIAEAANSAAANEIAR